MDRTFGPQVMFQKASDTDNLAPCYGLQFFGHIAIDSASEPLTVTLKDVADRALWATTLEPRRDHTRVSMNNRTTLSGR